MLKGTASYTDTLATELHWA